MQSPSEFLTQLATAEHESQIVIAINVDIRGFSRFSLKVESVEASIFIKKFYAQLLERYFTDPVFFKPTGDGMLMIFPVDEEELEERTNGLIQQSLRLLEDFPRMFDEIPIINFPVPTGVGIGMARGAASRFVADGEILDYSGKVLNLASRLMDMARPSGLVLDASIGFQLLTEDLAGNFEQDDIYVKSVAERKPISVRFTHEMTEIPASAHIPIDKVTWHRITKEWTCAALLAAPEAPIIARLEPPTVQPDAIEVAVRVVVGRPPEAMSQWFMPGFELGTRGGDQSVSIDGNELASQLVKAEVPGDTVVKFEVAYPIDPIPDE
jgi:class 3 adenylate cyclase